MPLYEYVCDTCQGECELLVRSGESPRCPVCGGTRLKQQLSVVAAHTNARRDPNACLTPSPTGCALPACRGGRCAMSD